MILQFEIKQKQNLKLKSRQFGLDIKQKKIKKDSKSYQACLLTPEVRKKKRIGHIEEPYFNPNNNNNG